MRARRWALLAGGVAVLCAAASFTLSRKAPTRTTVEEVERVASPVVKEDGPRREKRAAHPVADARSAAQPPPRPLASSAAEDALAAVRASIGDPSPEATARLVRALDDEEAVVRVEAIDGLVSRRHVPALARLVKLDPADDPFVAPSILGALGALGHAAAADDPLRRAALDRLVALLASEKERRGVDSAGHVIMIIEALGVLEHPDGAPVLERELGDPFHDVAGFTAIVLALGRIGQASTLTALARFRATRSPAPLEDPFDRALEEELLRAIDDVSRALRSGSPPLR